MWKVIITYTELIAEEQIPEYEYIGLIKILDRSIQQSLAHQDEQQRAKFIIMKEIIYWCQYIDLQYGE